MAAAAFDGKVVFLTGVTGFIGGLVLEQLLRTCPAVRKVYVALRPKRGQDPQQRLRQLLDSSLLFKGFREQHGSNDLLNKVQVVEADLSADGCGLSTADTRVLSREVNIFIHCAASLSLDLHVHEALRQNYFPTAGLLRLAEACPAVDTFCFVSTAYVNANLPRRTRVAERVYPLHDRGQPVQQGELVARLMALQPEAAAKEARRLLKEFGYLNTYLLSKTLTERLVLERDGRPMPVCIVRPALCGAVAGTPYPGFIGNAAGATSAILAMATGMATFTAYRPDSLLPLVPGDVVAAVVLAVCASMCVKADGQPLPQRIYHVCSSATYPITLQEFANHITAYFQKDPLRKKSIPFLQTTRAGKLQWVSDAAYRRRSTVRTAYFRMLCTAMRVAGQGRVASKVMLGWKTWRNLGCSAMDHDLIYVCDGAVRLLTALPEHERAGSMLVWSKEQGAEWGYYMRTYIAGVKHRYLREAPALDGSHGYVVMADARS